MGDILQKEARLAKQRMPKVGPGRAGWCSGVDCQERFASLLARAMRCRTRGADGSMQGAGANVKKDDKKRRGQAW